MMDTLHASPFAAKRRRVLHPVVRWHRVSHSAAGLLFFASAAELLAAPETSLVQKRTLLQELNMPAIWFLIACSMLIVWFATDVVLKSRRVALVSVEGISRVRHLFSEGDYAAAHRYVNEADSPFLQAVGAGLRRCGEGQGPAEEAMSTVLGKTHAAFQNKIAYLSVVGVIAPMVGLTGTVIGMIDAFSVMGQAGAADPSRLSGAIGHVLHATAGGLIVAIPAFVGYYLLRNRVSHAMQELGHELTELFRGFPYSEMHDVYFEGSAPCAAKPKPPERSRPAEMHPTAAQA